MAMTAQRLMSAQTDRWLYYGALDPEVRKKHYSRCLLYTSHIDLTTGTGCIPPHNHDALKNKHSLLLCPFRQRKRLFPESPSLKMCIRDRALGGVLKEYHPPTESQPWKDTEGVTYLPAETRHVAQGPLTAALFNNCLLYTARCV